MYVRKRRGKLQKFSKQKIIRSCRKAGAKLEVAKKVAEEVMKDVAISTEKIGKAVIRSLKKLDKEAAKTFEQVFKKKWKKKRKR